MKKILSKNRQLLVNMVASIVTMAINYGISFLLTPFIVSTVGAIAYGFVNLANTMINYVTVVTIALNSVSGRFITIEFHQGHKREAEEYFSSVLMANAVIAGGLIAVAVPVIWNLEKLVRIPASLIVDVKLLFAFIALNFVLTIVGDVFTVATFITNQLYLSSIVNTLASLIKVALMLLMFGLLPTNVMYVGIISVVCTAITYACNMALTRRLTPELRPSAQLFSIRKIRELIGAGIWSSVTKLSQILSDGLDLLISNIGISAFAMGQLSIAYTIPTLMASLLATIASLFNPQQMYYYAKGDTEGILGELKLNMKMTGFFTGVVFCGIIVWGNEFFRLWVPSQNIKAIYQLSVISVMSLAVSGVSAPLNSVFLLTNKLKVNSLVWLGISMIDAITVIILLITTHLGIYAVAAVSKFVGLIINLTYLPIYAAKCLCMPKKTFYPLILKYMGCTATILSVFLLLKQFCGPCENWFAFLPYCSVFAIIGLAMNFFLYLTRQERAYLINVITNRLKGKRA